MKIEQKFQNGLIELISQHKLDEVNVISLCKFVGSNRQTFYYHYRDISDVIESILLENNIGYQKNLNDFPSILKALLAYINSNYLFLYEICRSFAVEKVESLIYTFVYKQITQLLKKVDISEARTIARYMSNITNKEIIIWINSKRSENQTNLINRLNKIYTYLTTDYLKR